jgi:branched-chain amino acid transport system permease protein
VTSELVYLFQTLVDGLLLSGGYILIALGLGLIFGVVNYVNVAQAEFSMLAMYATWVLWVTVGLDPFVSLAVTVPMFALIGVVFYTSMVRPVRNRDHGVHILMTLGLAFILQNVALLVFSADVRTVRTAYSAASINLGGVAINLVKLVAFAIAIALFVALIAFLNHTRTGRAIRAVAQDESLAAAFGVNVDRVFMITVAIAIGLAAAAGTVMMPHLFVQPMVGQFFVLFAFAIVVLGGMGNLKGALVAGLIVGVVEAFGQVYIGGLAGRLMVFSLILVILYLRPSGLFGRSAL